MAIERIVDTSDHEDDAEEKIIEVPSEIASPIIDRLAFIKNKDLSSAFISLLTKANG